MLKELRNQHRTIIQMVFSGYRNKEIAERLEMSDCTVSQIVRSPLGQAYLEGLQDKAQEATLDVRKKLVSMNKSALSVLERIMNPAEKAPHSVQFGAAKDVLDRTGYKAPDRLTVDMTMSVKTDDEIDAEINAMQQSIDKTYLQSPGAEFPQEKKTEELSETAKNETEAFTNEQPLQADSADQTALTVDDKDMGSSGQLINSGKSSKQKDLINGCNKSLKNSPTPMPEESISLLSKIPANIIKA